MAFMAGARGSDGSAATAEEPAGRGWMKAVAIGVLIPLVGALFAAAFLWPMTSAKPGNIELAVAGPEQARAGIVQTLTANSPDMFDITQVDTRDEAVAAIEKREVSGAVVFGDQIEMLTASAGGAQVSQVLSQMATGMQAAMAAQGQQVQVPVTDVVPGTARSGVSQLVIIPALLIGMAGSMVSFFVVKKPVRRFATLFTAAIVGGLAASAVLGPWFNVLEGSYWTNAAGIALGVLAIAGTITGLGAALGPAGLALGAVAILLFGNPWSGMMVPTEFLPTPWATIGHYFPNGQLITLVRSLAYFPDASTGAQWGVLSIWAGAGLLLLALGSLLHSRRSRSARAVAA